MTKIFEEIIESAKLDQIDSLKTLKMDPILLKELSKEEINVLQFLNAQPQNFTECNTILDFLGIPQLTEDINTNVQNTFSYLCAENCIDPARLQLLKEKLQIRYHLAKEEEEIDKIEIKLSKLKQQYSFINNIENIDVGALEREISELEEDVNSCSSQQKQNPVIPPRNIKDINKFVKFVKDPTSLEQIQKLSISESTKLPDILQYFVPLIECNAELVDNIRQEIYLIHVLENNDSIDTSIKQFLLIIIKEKSIFLDNLCEKLGKDKLTVTNMVKEFVNHDIVDFHHLTELIMLKKI
ncbi:hypothetical protein EDEG_00592 [Edhazardia aedis USNM 41457]|uniref:Uncharacterized protein n=1 Tax=Edhazardia aedis (strain USNM 41457) TaxID=1003232 RepID=J9DC94_EDHAE|nr:hypothetical protein EDEG_00592 [Edhazardia aedis USNM 41457]|eukprot:EJW05366.1 hypothetical protein EDEG_00592 [Edhazardia aedis USNM 41457]